MPRERYILPSNEQIRKWEEERAEKERLNELRRELIKSALRKQKKEALVELLLSLDTYDPTPRWAIEAFIDLKKPLELMTLDLRHAIELATQVDKSKLNTNFSYNWQAYAEIARAFNSLLGAGELQVAKEIAIEFMRKASYQVECSDEGAMVTDIETCLKPVIQAVADEPPTSRLAWTTHMLRADGCGFICRSALENLRV